MTNLQKLRQLFKEMSDLLYDQFKLQVSYFFQQFLLGATKILIDIVKYNNLVSIYLDKEYEDTSEPKC